MKIKVLPNNLVNQIAAGEVVEGPASVVKELLENSLDAKARNIVIELEEGAKKLIKIIDDGIGMSPEDATLSLERHATSKISELNDLFHINSFGFRGEALPSIASISNFTLETRSKENQTGFQIKVKGGKVESSTEVGLPVGTQIQVHNLFWNVPARKKHLKTDNTEFRKVIKVVNEIAMVNPEVSFRVMKDGKDYLKLSPQQTLKERISELTKIDQAKLIEVFSEGLDYKISGYITKPEENFKNKSKQYVFVNKRPIVNHLVNYCVKESFGSLLAKDLFPGFFLHIELEPMLVDVNVHPRKTEVRFVNQAELLNKISQSITKALGNEDLTPQFSFGNKKFSYEIPKINLDSQKKQNNWNADLNLASPNLNLDLDSGQTLNRSPYLALGQAHKAYIIAESKRGIIIIDQHAAHERIIYEQLKKSRTENKQSLLIPEIIELSASEDSLLQEYFDTFTELGFEIEDIGNKTYKISSIPSSLSHENLSSIIQNVLSDLENSGKSKSSKNPLDRLITYLSCRSAIKFNDSLSLLEQQELLNQLEDLESGYTCPHGRALKFEISREELDKSFGRN